MTTTGPNPKFLDEMLTIEGVERHKRHDCRRYVWCLDIAAAAGWSQFHCNACDAYVPRPKDGESDDLLTQATPKVHRQIVHSTQKARSLLEPDHKIDMTLVKAPSIELSVKPKEGTDEPKPGDVEVEIHVLKRNRFGVETHSDDAEGGNTEDG